MKRAAAFFLGFVFLGTGVHGAGDAAKQDLKRLQGKWKVVERILDGKKREPSGAWTISGHEISYGPQTVARGVFKLDATTKPRRFDLDLAGLSNKGIYQIEGDTLRICQGGKEQRPKAFESKPGSKYALTVLKRVKDEK
jgi:uncharacterized protein (TIGR03067 family)